MAGGYFHGVADSESLIGGEGDFSVLSISWIIARMIETGVEIPDIRVLNLLVRLCGGL
jgi:hypothetical protein